MPGNIAKLTRGVIESRRILRDFKPDVLFFTGGFVAAPMAVAGRNIPTVLYLERCLSGRKERFAKSSYGLNCTVGSNPTLSAGI